MNEQPRFPLIEFTLLLGLWWLAAARAADYRELGYGYLSPVPGAPYTAPQTRHVLVRFSNLFPSDLLNMPTFISVEGATSGAHAGTTHVAGDGRTVIFTMSQGFSANELVSVTIDPHIGPGASGAVEPYQYQFCVGGPMPGFVATGATSAVGSARVVSRATEELSAGPISGKDLRKSLGYPLIMPNGVAVPSDFPRVKISVNDNPDRGYIFINTRGGGGKNYNVIFDNSGSPVWYEVVPDERWEMKAQPNGLLTMLTQSGAHRFVGINTNYVEVASYQALNGYSTDEHELRVLPDGRYLLLGAGVNAVDMSRYLPGGNPRASVVETVLQEFTPAGELIFQWRAWDNYDIRDLRLVNPLGMTIQFPHMNALEIDEDGHILVSCRHLSEVTKINRDTGEIIWRLGGSHSSFTFINDPLNGFESQHNVATTGKNRYLVFDNGNLHAPPVSRAVEYELNLTNMTARLVWQYPKTPTTSLFSPYMGNSQRLPNGNTLINWAIGNLPKLTEVRPDGSKAFEMNWVDGYEAYRVWRSHWRGVALKPNLIVEHFPDRIALIFNQFGNTNVSYYRIYAGTSPCPTTVLRTSALTLAEVSNLENQRQYYFRVTAVDETGAESAASEERTVFVRLVRPGENIVVNGDFSQGTDAWELAVSGAAVATWSVASGSSYVDAENPGGALADIQLRQIGLGLFQGREYVLAFDAWSAEPRTIEVRVGQNLLPFMTYKLVNPALTPVRRRFSYPFVMLNATDWNALLAFNLGAASADVYLDDVVLFMVAPGDFNRDGAVDFLDLSIFAGQWLEQGGGHTADFNGDTRVDYSDLSILGRNWSGQH